MAQSSDTKVERVLIKNIIIDNYRKQNLDKKSLQELADSIKVNDIISPVKLRKNKEGEYDLIYGQRRVMAAELAGKTDVPAIVVDITDDQLEVEQLVENMDRQDVHPMDEATKFASMINAKRNPQYRVEDLAKLLNRSQTYILQRIELLQLIPELQKDFLANKFNISMAVEFARLSHKAQKDSLRSMKDNGNYRSLNSLKDWISRHVIRNLDKAPFKKDDATLFPEAGPCTTCPKRSGANLLFGDLKEKDLCFDGVCFAMKSALSIVLKIDEQILKIPDIIFHNGTSYNEEVHPLILKKLKEHHREMIVNSYGSGYTTYKETGSEPVKVMTLGGVRSGEITTWYKTANKKAKGKVDTKALKASNAKPEAIAASIDEDIAGIKTRQKRSLELDAEKVWTEVRKEVITTKNKKVVAHDGPLTKIEKIALIRSFDPHGWESGTSYERDELGWPEVLKTLGIKPPVGETRAEEMATLLLKASDKDLDKLIAKGSRWFMLKSLNNADQSHRYDISRNLIKKVVEQHFKADIDKIQAAQDEVAAGRIERANARIETLKKQKQNLKTKEAVGTAKAVDKTAPKKVARASVKKSPAKKKK